MYEIEQADLDIIEEHVSNDKIINAIKHFRSVTGARLKESKGEVYYYRDEGKWSWDVTVAETKAIGDLSKYGSLPIFNGAGLADRSILKQILCSSNTRCERITCDKCPLGEKAPEEDAIAYLLHILDEDK